MKKRIKALVMLSGGLDSKLTVKILKDLGIDMLGVNFNLPFGSGCCKQMCSWKFMQVEGMPLKIMDCTKGRLFKEYINMIKKPKFGRGTGMNPCIDCRIFMLKRAKQLMKKHRANFIVTGEVLGERPMSQHLKAMMLTEKESGLKGRLLRPLSAKLLEETIPEKKGWIDRSKMFDIQGRSRKRQIEMANNYKMSYPSPGGGCLLCEKEYAPKLINLFNHQKNVSLKDIELLKIGRHFRINDKIIVGRNQAENEVLQSMAKELDAQVLECKNVEGPITIVLGTNDAAIEKAAELTALYSDAIKKEIKKVIIMHNGKEIVVDVHKLNKEDFLKFKI